ncbi:MAG TPA: MerR family transcriptional regulator [Candidatus Dormibacteraeota bacterium]|nr:MerR family transcriptional regulator [Candidatus Dormibacteraeota bacterium]
MMQDLFPSTDPDSPSTEAAAPAAGQEGELFRIGEVCRLTGTKAFVLRYWETEFPMLAPQKSPKGHRLYRREDVDMVFEIKRLLYEQGFTIAGARRWLESSGREGSEGEPASAPTLPSGSTAARKRLVDLDQELRAILTLLESE